MEFQVGDRVVSLKSDGDGLRKGEFGTVVLVRPKRTPVIEWDDYNEHRHDSDGRVQDGHGWYIFSNQFIKHIAPVDFGILPKQDYDINSLFC